MCRKLMEQPEPATYWTRLSCDLGKWPKTSRCGAGELPLQDHVGDLNTVQCSRGRSERVHVPCAALFKAMILLDHAVQTLGPDRLDFGRATKLIVDFVRFSNARIAIIGEHSMTHLLRVPWSDCTPFAAMK